MLEFRLLGKCSLLGGRITYCVLGTGSVCVPCVIDLLCRREIHGAFSSLPIMNPGLSRLRVAGHLCPYFLTPNILAS